MTLWSAVGARLNEGAQPAGRQSRFRGCQLAVMVLRAAMHPIDL